MKICVFGASSPRVSEDYVKAVETLGEEIAKRGHTLVFGAGSNGLMGAVARGTARGGGKIQGVIPTFFKENRIEEIYTQCDEIIYTDSMRERKRVMEDLSDAFIITPGGIGTFEEFFEVLTLKQLGRHNKPIVIYNFDGYYDEMLASIESAMKKGFITENCLTLYSCTKSLESVLGYAEAAQKTNFSVKDLKEG